MADGWSHLVARWMEAGVIDAATADRISAFERSHLEPSRLHWPIWLALGFGALMVGAGILLFVSAHWDDLSPASRFALAIGQVALFHVAAVAAAPRFEALSTTLHAIGTVALGAGIFLGGQIFNLDEHWPGGMMLWALGAAAGWILLRDWPQMACAAILLPAWLSSEWIVATPAEAFGERLHVLGAGSFLLALAYFSALAQGRESWPRHLLVWIGTIALIPTALVLASATRIVSSGAGGQSVPVSTMTTAVGWSVAIGLPMLIAAVLRREQAFPNVIAVVWVVVLLRLPAMVGDVATYVWWAAGSAALIGWGVHEARTERINMGSALFAGTVLAFYFSHVMDKLSRSASLAGLGLLFLLGGWGLERMRRRLVRGTREEGP